jgi:hypothetical protein
MELPKRKRKNSQKNKKKAKHELIGGEMQGCPGT